MHTTAKWGVLLVAAVFWASGCSNSAPVLPDAAGAGDGPTAKDLSKQGDGRQDGVRIDAPLPDLAPADAAGDGDAAGSTDADAALDAAPDLLPPDLLAPDTWHPDLPPPDAAWPQKCQNALLLTLTAGKVTHKGDTSQLRDEFPKLTCGGSTGLAGPQAYHYLFLNKGQSYSVSLTPGFDAHFYIFSPGAFCQENDIQRDCSSSGSTGDFSPLIKAGSTGELVFSVPQNGYYYIAVDSTGAALKGSYTLTVEIDCSQFKDKCNNGVNVGGTCQAQPKSGTCDDEDPCTLGDTCQNIGGLGICKGAPKSCPGDTCNTGKCDKTSGLCVNVPKTGTISCDDGSLCTENDTCQNGTCKGTAKNCSSLTDTCNTGICNPADGKCMQVPKSGTIYCSDGDPCTENDACQGGVCKGTAKSCPGDQCNAGKCDAATGSCVKTYQAGACTDGDNCTVSDTCVKLSSGEGTCKGTAKTCSGDQCNTAKCDAATGDCVKTFKSGVCSDVDNCTVNDACVKLQSGEGTCKGTTKSCPGDQCNAGSCDPTSGACVKSYKAGTCSDGANCTINDTCVNVSGLGVCKGTAKVCSGDQCNTASCDPNTGNCVKSYKAGTCNDADRCTLYDTCQNVSGLGVCKGTAKVCNGDQCNTASCDPNTGNCVKSYKSGACSDGNSCTTGDSCINSGGIGVCKSGSWPLDVWEANNSCSAAKDRGSVNEGSWLSWGGSISPPSDVDWFRARGLEASHACWPGSSQTYYLYAQVSVPAGRTYQVCVYRDSCSGPAGCATGGGTITARVKVSGTCIYTDDTTGYIMIRAVDGKQECQNYSVAFKFD